MKKIIKALNYFKDINTAYKLSNESIENNLKEILNAKVCTPIIGKFSTGKSALVNTVLGYSRKILPEDITPETAVPAEILYDDMEDNIAIISNDGEHRQIDVSEYRNIELDANKTKCVRLKLRNSFLEEIPDVMIVDMPGFESGYEVHNKAIDNYLPQSLAYIVAFPADDMIVRSSVGNILKELCIHDMPICVVITKYDKKNEDFDITLKKLKENLKRFIGEREVTYCVTTSFTGDADELKEFLRNIQSKSQDILANKFKDCVLNAANITENYLNTIIKNSGLSESELDEKEESLEKQMKEMNEKFSKEKEDFDAQMSSCVEEVKADVKIAVEAEESTYIAMAMNNQCINDQLNTTIRNAITTSIKKHFIPKVERYLKRVANCLNDDAFSDINFSFNINIEKMSKGITSTAVAFATATLLGGPILGVIVAGITALVNKIKGDKKREEIKDRIRMQLRSELYPKVLSEVGNGVQIALTKQLKIINTHIDEEISAQKDTLEKAMNDIRKQQADEKSRRDNLLIDAEEDLHRIEAIKNDL